MIGLKKKLNNWKYKVRLNHTEGYITYKTQDKSLKAMKKEN